MVCRREIGSYEISIVDVAGRVGPSVVVRSFLYPPQLYADPVAAALLAVQGGYV